MSESVYHGLFFSIFGTLKHVVILRETQDIYDLIYKRISSNKRVTRVLSGSSREGSRMEGSDMDYVLAQWPHSDLVYGSIWNIQFKRSNLDPSG